MAITPTLPAPLPPWLRAAVYLAPFAYAAGEALFEHLSEADGPESLGWVRFVASGDRRTPAGTSEDRAQISFDVVNISGGDVDTSWTDADLNEAGGAIGTMLGLITGYQSTAFTWRECRAYAMRFNSSGPGFADSGDPLKIFPYAASGTKGDTSVLPYQVSLSVTERTVLRKHWGRFYLPCPSTDLLDANGRWKSASIEAIAAIVGDMYEWWSNHDYLPVVASPGGRTLYSVTQIQVDDIPDIQRRRRARTTLLRAQVPA